MSGSRSSRSRPRRTIAISAATTTWSPRSELERVDFPPPLGTLEAFNTSGGVSTLVETYRERLKNLDYKTLRYPGHALAMQWMLHLGLFSSDPVEVDGHPVAPRKLVAK